MTQHLQQQLIEYVYSANSSAELADMLGELLSPSELESISARLEIAKLLQLGLPQREIAATLGVGIATVTRGSREIKKGKFTKHLNKYFSMTT